MVLECAADDLAGAGGDLVDQDDQGEFLDVGLLGLGEEALLAVGGVLADGGGAATDAKAKCSA